MHVGVLALRFHLSGCRSLKEKRRRLAALKGRYGRLDNVAVCESGALDSHQDAEWSFVVAAGSAKVVEQIVADIQRGVDALDAYLVGSQLTWV